VVITKDNKHGLARTPGGNFRSLNPFASLSWSTEGVFMNRLLAKVLLVLLLFGLLFSLYSFSRGRIMEGLYIFPFLVTIYIVINFGGKGKE
jgi:hypothetical protein